MHFGPHKSFANAPSSLSLRLAIPFALSRSPAKCLVSSSLLRVVAFSHIDFKTLSIGMCSMYPLEGTKALLNLKLGQDTQRTNDMQELLNVARTIQISVEAMAQNVAQINRKPYFHSFLTRMNIRYFNFIQSRLEKTMPFCFNLYNLLLR